MCQNAMPSRKAKATAPLAIGGAVHTDFFSEAYQEAGLPFSEESQVVCEEFEMVFPGAEQ